MQPNSQEQPSALSRFFDAFSLDRLVEGSARRARQDALEQYAAQAQSLADDVAGRPSNFVSAEDDLMGRNVHNDREIYEAEAQIVGRPLAENRIDIPGGRRSPIPGAQRRPSVGGRESPILGAQRRPSLGDTIQFPPERRPSINRDGLTTALVSMATAKRRPSITSTSSVGRRPSITSTSSVGRRPSITSTAGRRNSMGQLIDDPDALPEIPTHIPLVILEGVDDYDQYRHEEPRDPFSLGPPDAQEVKGKLQLRIIGVIIFAFSIIEIGLGGSAATFIRKDSYRMDTPVKVPPNGYGAWWAVPIVLAAGICAIASTRKILIIWALFLGLIGLIPLVIGAVWDGIASSFFRSMSVCVGESSIHRYDDAHVGTCYARNITNGQGLCNNMGVMCDLVTYADTWKMLGDDEFFQNRRDCFCTNGVYCYEMILNTITWKRGNYCGNVLLTLPILLQCSTAFLVLLFIATMFLIVYCLYSLCCGNRLERKQEIIHTRPAQSYERIRRPYELPQPQAMI